MFWPRLGRFAGPSTCRGIQGVLLGMVGGERGGEGVVVGEKGARGQAKRVLRDRCRVELALSGLWPWTLKGRSRIEPSTCK